MSSESAVFFRLHRVPVCSEAELLIFIMTAKCKFTGEEKVLIISSHRKENFPNENFWTVEVSRCLSKPFEFQALLSIQICNQFKLQHLLRFSFMFQNADYVVYPRSAQAYADPGTSTWVNQKGYTTFA